MDREGVIRLGVAASGVAPRGARALRDRCGSWAEAAREASRREGVPDRLRQAFANAVTRGERVAEDCARLAVHVVARAEAAWPESMEALTDPPEVLFVRGSVAQLAEPAVAMVGTRESSMEGERWTERAALRLAEEGWGTVSGLARGIDAAAHRGSLAGEGGTVAVLGCGVDVPYPAENRELHARIGEEGALVSEFAPRTEPRSHHFPRRNRILAALAVGTVVVECRRRSGAMITARHALELGREVFAVPGWPDASRSDGPLQLLRDGARLVRSAADLLEDLGGVAAGPSPGEEEARALQALRAGADSEEEVAAALGVDAKEARERLARLELMGLVSPGGGGG